MAIWVQLVGLAEAICAPHCSRYAIPGTHGAATCTCGTKGTFAKCRIFFAGRAPLCGMGAEGDLGLPKTSGFAGCLSCSIYTIYKMDCLHMVQAPYRDVSAEGGAERPPVHPWLAEPPEAGSAGEPRQRGHRTAHCGDKPAANKGAGARGASWRPGCPVPTAAPSGLIRTGHVRRWRPSEA